MSISLSVKIEEDSFDYIKSLGFGNITRGVERLVREHREKSFQWDMEATLEFLSNFVQAIEFREQK